MDAWRNELLRLADLCMGRPAPMLDIVVTVVMALAAFVLVLRTVAKAIGCHMPETGRSLAVLLLGLILTIPAYLALRIYVVPLISNPLIRNFLPVALVLVIVVTLIIPYSCWMLRGKYFEAMLSVLLAILAGAGVLLLTAAGWRALEQGGKGMDRTKKRTESINEMLQ